ncbi:MAG: hypothetical protein JW891_03180 [Candidatus Lokiarchaeota archaeon]|nr:hypothetical protein [Candidatus Lokiarchaeota archaeon]
MLSAIIVISCFIGVIILIITDKLNRAIAALLGAIITYFTLILIEGKDFTLIMDLLFGTLADGFINLHSLILILSMMLIVIVAHEAGLFQFISIMFIKYSKGKPVPLLIGLCSITVLISALLNNILTVIILIPLTITMSRILNIDPSPYILTEAVLVNIGGTMFSISSIPNILITAYAKISFLEFFLNVGVFSLIIFVFTVIFFVFLYKSSLRIPEESAKILREFNVWNFVQNKRLLYESMIALIIVFVLFILLPTSVITPDMIALTVAIILIVVSRLNPKEIISKVDLELIFYLLGIFVITGAFDILGITQMLGSVLSLVSGNAFVQLIFVLWISAFLSSIIDNIPITQVLIPVIGEMPVGIGNQKFYSLAIGANWGDNLTPLGDNILVVNLAEKHKRPISFKQFFKIGFVTTLYQLAVISLIFLVIFYLFIGLVIIIIIYGWLTFFYLLSKRGPKSLSLKINNLSTKFKNIIIK